MKKYILLLLLSAVFAFGAENDAAAAEKARWTFMVYMNADNDLDAFGPLDIAELETAGSTKSLNIIVQLDRKDKPARRYYVTRRNAGSALDDWGVSSVMKNDLGEIDSGDHKEVVKFFKWSSENYPAERYALVIWNHGSGWKAAGKNSAKGISYDFDSKNNISTKGLGICMDAVTSTGGRPLDLLIMDACLMQMMEIIYEVKDGVRFVAASEDIEPDNGIPYDTILKPLSENPKMNAEELSKLVCQAFYEKYKGRANAPAIYSAVNCSKAEELAQKLNEMAAAITALSANEKLAVKAVREKSLKFTYSEYIDIGHFIKLVLEEPSLSKIKPQAETAMLAYQKCVIDNRVCSSTVPAATGISIYFPKYGLTPGYSELKFSRFQWDEMTREILNIK